jgi:predicted nucleic acid-binding protein
MTEVRRIVSNTGPLISLEKLRQGYDFIRQLYDTIIIPPGVLDEVAEGQFATPQAYVQHYGIVDLFEVQAVARSEQLPEVARLHVGEAQAIQLARNWHSHSSLKKRWGVGWLRGWASPSRGSLGKC